MARTIEEIKQDMTARFMQMEAVKSAYGLDGSKGFDDCFSRASLESVLFWVFAACVWAHEKLFDLHRADVEARIALLEPHTLRWYVNKAKAFMWDQTGSVKLQLKQDTDVYDLSGLTDTSEEALAKYRPVKYAVATHIYKGIIKPEKIIWYTDGRQEKEVMQYNSVRNIVELER